MPLRACLSRLTEISRILGEGRIDVEDALDLCEEGAQVHARAQQVLHTIRLRIDQLSTALPGGDAEQQTGAGEHGAAPSSTPT